MTNLNVGSVDLLVGRRAWISGISVALNFFSTRKLPQFKSFSVTTMRLPKMALSTKASMGVARLLEVVPRTVMKLSGWVIMLGRWMGCILFQAVTKIKPTKLMLAIRFSRSLLGNNPTNLVKFASQSFWVSLEVMIQPPASFGTKAAASSCQGRGSGN